jgi:hypothetical protein
MGYIRIREAEILVRGLFRERTSPSLGEILCAGMEAGLKGLSGLDEATPGEGDEKGWDWRFENAVNVTLGWPVKWRTYLRHVITAAHESEREDCEELGVAGVDVPRIQGSAAVEAALRAVERNFVPWLNHPQVFAGAARRALTGWTKPTPPWSNQGPLIELNADWRACQCILISAAFPRREPGNARKVRWVAGKSLFRAPLIGGIHR